MGKPMLVHCMHLRDKPALLYCGMPTGTHSSNLRSHGTCGTTLVRIIRVGMWCRYAGRVGTVYHGVTYALHCTARSYYVYG